MQRIKKKDTVIILSGKDKGKKGVVLEVDACQDLVRVQGVAIATHHVKARNQKEVAHIKRTEAFIPLSKVMLFDMKAGRPCRVNYVRSADGVKLRVSNQSQEVV